MKTMHKFMKIMMAMAFLLPLFSCVDEFLEKKNDSEILEEDGNYLKFKVSLQNLTRDNETASTGTLKREIDEEYEDYIDEKSLRVLFFYADEKIGDKENPNYNKLFAQFGKGDFSLIPISNTIGNGQENWYVRIPVNDYNSEFARAVRKNNFKIAVLANWPNKDFRIDEKDDISKLHRQVKHDAYNGNASKAKAYGKILDTEGKLGLTTNWVKDGDWKNEENAEEFLRSSCYPGGDNAEEYGHLWMYWNFASVIKDSKPSEDTENHYKWFQQNKNDLRSWMTDLQNNKLKNFTPENVVTGNFVYIGENAFIDANKEGIVLPKVEEADFNKKEFIRISVPASGNLKIKWGSVEAGKSAKIKVERRDHIDDESEKDHKWPDTTTLRVAEEKDQVDWDIDVTGNEEYISIFSTDGNVIIYEIEYICATYLGNIDRIGINPKDQYIPMYGVQVFDKLDNLWIEGTSFDLSNFNMTGPYPHLDGNTGQMVIPYDYREISLIRSVAKVVLKIPIKEKPHHIFLRNMNRNAFCEPLDVSTPTHLLWEDDGEYSAHNPKCEFFSIKGQDPFYKGENLGISNDKQLENYSEKLAWYYSAWGIESTSKEMNDEVFKHEKAANYYGGEFPSDFVEGRPHILNPMIEPSDFCEFLYAGEVDGLYKKYVLYVPEKFVDDPNNLDDQDGVESSDPKVCHIEFRTLNSPFKNLEDDNCYRIYFTENGFNKQYKGDAEGGYTPPTFGKIEGVYDTWENMYENNVENLKVHWPILRNHVYSFTVLDAESAMLVIQLEIVPWKQVDENRYNW